MPLDATSGDRRPDRDDPDDIDAIVTRLFANPLFRATLITLIDTFVAVERSKGGGESLWPPSDRREDQRG
jgi:hypothetical protein